MGSVLAVDALNPQRGAVDAAARVLREGGAVVLPTDTVYGIAQSVKACPEGAGKLFAIKRRDPGKTIAWLVGDAGALDEYGRDVPEYAHRLAEAFWPGGLTLAVPASSLVGAPWLGPDGTVALRMPACEVTLAVIRAVGSALATTSANTSGLPAPGSFAQLEQRIVDEADLTLRSDVPRAGLASTVVVCSAAGPRIVREGGVGAQDIIDAL